MIDKLEKKIKILEKQLINARVERDSLKRQLAVLEDLLEKYEIDDLQETLEIARADRLNADKYLEFQDFMVEYNLKDLEQLKFMVIFYEAFSKKRENQIIVLRYGLKGFMPKTQREVAKHLNISRSYVSRIEKRALEKLRIEFGNNIPHFDE